MARPGLFLFCGLLLLCGGLGGCVTSGDGRLSEADGIDRVAAGEPTVMQQTYMTMDMRCRPVKRPTAVLTQPPRYGKVRMLPRRGAATYGPGPYRHCDGKVGPSLAFEYISAPDYRGRDAFAVRVRYADGELRHGRFEVEIR
ncbi:hypothetical protein BHK69_05900 [Bosea vaviloviae]|uniref:Lipoprotein n=2 Tax=Bosea vaviloviae TaxID=1526658 RepID=A0A1D7TY62_9HYPH|nr:hypothetical protein BHK69_05900 [Bosea vaviloviae]